MPDYRAETYWEELLSRQYSEAGVGYPALALAFNQEMYRSLRAAVDGVLPVGHRPGRVLDVGSGTGVWVAFWQQRGATSVDGLELTQAGVEHLRQTFPDATFAQADVGAAELPVDGRFDTVSAMSVLLHVTDEAAYDRAVRNLAQRVAPGGTLVLIEPALVHPWWGAPFGPEAHNKARPLAELLGALGSYGLEVAAVRPATVLLSDPIDARRPVTLRAMTAAWGALCSLAASGHEGRARVVAGVLGPADRALLRLLPKGPSAKVVVARRPVD